MARAEPLLLLLLFVIAAFFYSFLLVLSVLFCCCVCSFTAALDTFAAAFAALRMRLLLCCCFQTNVCKDLLLSLLHCWCFVATFHAFSASFAVLQMFLLLCVLLLVVLLWLAGGFLTTFVVIFCVFDDDFEWCKDHPEQRRKQNQTSKDWTRSFQPSQYTKKKNPTSALCALDTRWPHGKTVNDITRTTSRL